MLEFLRLRPRAREAPGLLDMLYVGLWEGDPLLRQAPQVEPRPAAVRADLVSSAAAGGDAPRGQREGEAKALDAEAVTVQEAGLGARSPSRSLTRGAADFRGKPEIVICPLVLADLSWYSLTTIFQGPSHATQA